MMSTDWVLSLGWWSSLSPLLVFFGDSQGFLRVTLIGVPSGRFPTGPLSLTLGLSRGIF